MGRVDGQGLGWKPILSRSAAAVLGGYALTYAVTVCLTLLLPLDRTEAMLTGAMVSFAVYTGAILWAFAASTPRRAWIGLLALTALCSAVALPFAMAIPG